MTTVYLGPIKLSNFNRISAHFEELGIRCKPLEYTSENLIPQVDIFRSGFQEKLVCLEISESDFNKNKDELKDYERFEMPSASGYELIDDANQINPNYTEQEKTDSVMGGLVDPLFTSFNRFGHFTGRASRREFWTLHVFTSIVFFGFNALLKSYEQNALINPWVYLVGFFLLVIYFQNICVASRRLFDAGYNKWWSLLMLVPGLHLIVLYFCLKPPR